MTWQKRNPQAPRLRSSAPGGNGARRMGGMMLLAGATLGLGGCKVSDVSREGPKPAPTAVQRVDPTFPQEAVVCSEQGGTLEIAGSGFSPLPVNTLREDESLALPKVTLVDGSGNGVEVPVSKLDVAAGKMTVTLAANALPAGTYDVVVDNPNGQSGTLAGSVRVVPPPQVTGIEPATVPSGTITPVTLTGAHFRGTADGVLPTAFLTPVGTTVQYGLDGIALPSDTQLTGNTPATLDVGRYDVTVRNPEGCQATLPD
ncbi:MAG TPA: hypothetical protein VLQ93_21080, partial [Myxococcaceae bacterium]|nr:hypothetical protein [Myxococcaceae bacterium]